jgi:hypothetical protein
MNPSVYRHGSDSDLLLLIDTSDDIEALVRSGQRRVLHWSHGPDRGVDGLRDRVERFHGELSDPATYAGAAGAHAVTAVIDLPDLASAEAALHALRTVRPDAAVLLLSSEVEDAPGTGRWCAPAACGTCCGWTWKKSCTDWSPSGECTACASSWRSPTSYRY